jgi:uncharacterized protein DUF4350
LNLRKYLLFCVAGLAAVLTMLVWFYPVETDFAATNDAWNGYGGISHAEEIKSLSSLHDLPSLQPGMTLLVIPYTDFSAAELSRLKRFVQDGGRLVLADDYGKGNQVLSYLGIKARFSGERLRDPVSYYRTENFPEIGNLQSDALMDGIDSLILNHATILKGVAPTEILASSSSFSYLDINDNGKPDGIEPQGAQPVVSRHQYGTGTVLLVADPSIFINAMQEVAENRIFVDNIVGSGAVPLYLDQSHLTFSRLEESQANLAGFRAVFTTPSGTILTVVAALLIIMLPVWREAYRRHTASKGENYYEEN